MRLGSFFEVVAESIEEVRGEWWKSLSGDGGGGGRNEALVCAKPFLFWS